MKKIFVILVMLLAVVLDGRAQMPGGTPVEVSHKTQVINGRRYFIHIVDQGQTVYAISRAYGLKEVEAVTKKDIHFLHVGDTVWLPCKGQKLQDGFTAPSAEDPDGVVKPAESKAEDKPATKASGTSSKPAQSTQKPAQSAQKPAQSAQKPAQSAQKPASKSAAKPAASQEKAEAAVSDQPLSAPAFVRPRVNMQSIVVSLMMPFNLSQMDNISTSKFDVEQRGKTNYKSLEFIQFYEGMLLGLERLEKMGYDVTLNVVDVEGTTDEDVERAFRSHNVAQSDLLIAMLTRQPFEKAAKLAKESNLFVVNPVSDRSEIVVGNPYVFKCMPSLEAMAKTAVSVIRRTKPGRPVYIVQSNAKAEKPTLAALTAALDDRGDITYNIVDWAQPSKFTALLKANSNAVVVSLYDQDKSKNRIYAQQLLNKLSAFKTKTPCLFTFEDWSVHFTDVDFAQMQALSYHTFCCDWYRENPQQKEFIEAFRERYKTEPTNVYAGMANDIILYFVCGIQQKGTDFFKSPNIIAPQGMLSPLSFSQSRSDYGFENQYAVMYRMSDFHFIPVL